ncbi:hypothetical protein ACJVC5_02275 [Peredibacter sp. HCB2-198]|uniref:hypothetical protein n=1 Tax=Peredibacter sp. HCB2-198 TaxID=3383025 RepID=UPI0038B5F23F
MKRRSLVLSLFLLTGCAELYTGRSYLSEMENNNDARYFNPREDFPVVGGDSGRYWNTEEETRDRTPASEGDLAEENRKRSLRDELRKLEDSQSDDGSELYQKHKHQLKTVSERIYFLELPPSERYEYLASRGFLEEEKDEYVNSKERAFAVSKQDIVLGMTKNEVVESWGKPLRIEIAGNPVNENERWLYRMRNGQKFIYFESGQVQGWE